jgi:hypothetical protein
MCHLSVLLDYFSPTARPHLTLNGWTTTESFIYRKKIPATNDIQTKEKYMQIQDCHDLVQLVQKQNHVNWFVEPWPWLRPCMMSKSDWICFLELFYMLAPNFCSCIIPTSSKTPNFKCFYLWMSPLLGDDSDLARCRIVIGFGVGGTWWLPLYLPSWPYSSVGYRGAFLVWIGPLNFCPLRPQI